MTRKITQKSLLLSLFHAAGNTSIPIKTLVAAGEIFGFAGSTVRVTVIRLVRSGTLESDTRGMYRLSGRGRKISRFIGTWKEGEQRLKPWDGTWLCCLLPQKAYRTPGRIRRFLNMTGFQEGLPSLWVRPNNLAMGIERLGSILSHPGGRDDMVQFVGYGFEDRITERWTRSLWPVDILMDTQNRFLQKINKSASRLDKMPLENALVESFLVGSEAIHLLFSDPLLPHDIMDPGPRQALTRAMIAYDRIGKRVWSRRFEEINMDRSPAHLQLVAGA